MTQTKRVVSIGCSGCGALAALMLKKLNPSLEVTIIREPQEKGLLTRCATPYICCGDVMVDSSYKDDSIFTEKRIQLVNVRAVGIDKEKKVKRSIKKHRKHQKNLRRKANQRRSQERRLRILMIY